MMVVLAPAVGAAPFPLLKEGVFGAMERNSTYPVAVAPVLGKLAALHDKLILVVEEAVAVSDVA